MPLEAAPIAVFTGSFVAAVMHAAGRPTVQPEPANLPPGAE